jgi:hypothetical protein
MNSRAARAVRAANAATRRSTMLLVALTADSVNAALRRWHVAYSRPPAG